MLPCDSGKIELHTVMVEAARILRHWVKMKLPVSYVLEVGNEDSEDYSRYPVVWELDQQGSRWLEKRDPPDDARSTLQLLTLVTDRASHTQESHP